MANIGASDTSLQWQKDPCYTGSVQTLYTVDNEEDLLISVVSDQGSVFDIGTLFTVPKSSVSRTAVRALIFSALADKSAWCTLAQHTQLPAGLPIDRLQQQGALTHHVGVLDAHNNVHAHFATMPTDGWSNKTVIRKFAHVQPTRNSWQGNHWYDYNTQYAQPNRMIALEYLVRMGVVTCSSLLEQYQAMPSAQQQALCEQLGVHSLQHGTRFALPCVECTSKHEPVDRHLALQEASMIAALDATTFAHSLALASGGMLLAQMLFAQLGVRFWDGKWEFACCDGELYFADTLDTDSVRLTCDIVHADSTYAVHFSKQAIREYFIICHNEWYKAVLEAQQTAHKQGVSVADALMHGQQHKHYPPTPTVDATFLRIQEQKAHALLEIVPAFSNQWLLDAQTQAHVSAMLQEIAVAELTYYKNTDHFDAFKERSRL